MGWQKGNYVRKRILGVLLALTVLAGVFSLTPGGVANDPEPASAATIRDLTSGTCAYAYHNATLYGFDCGWIQTDYNTYHVTMFHYYTGWIHTVVWGDEANNITAMEGWALDMILPQVSFDGGGSGDLTLSYYNNRSNVHPNGQWPSHSYNSSGAYQSTSSPSVGAEINVQWVTNATHRSVGWGNTTPPGIRGVWHQPPNTKITDSGVRGAMIHRLSYISHYAGCCPSGVTLSPAYMTVK